MAISHRIEVGGWRACIDSSCCTLRLPKTGMTYSQATFRRSGRVKNLIYFAVLAAILSVGNGCSRHHYRVRADNDGYGRVIEKSNGTPWRPPGDYSVYPPQHSRLYDPTCIEDPSLPAASPQLYDYDLPTLPPRDNERFTQAFANRDDDDMNFDQAEEAIPPTPSLTPTPVDDELQPPPAPTPVIPIDLSASASASVFSNVSYGAGTEATTARGSNPVLLAQTEGAYEEKLMANESASGDGQDAQDGVGEARAGAEEAEDEEDTFDDSPRTRLVPLPKSYWEQIPADCLARMFEFATVRAEYEATYGKPPSRDLLDDSPKLALEDIIDLTLLNSRELQTQKEQLFRTALTLTLERFDYQLKPSVNGNGTAAQYDHSRFGGITDDTLRIPTSLELEKMLYTGGDFLGRFANSVLLTFNGPQGFAVDVSSELLFSLSQSLLQRDVRLENLTQAERNVVYAARDFTRFRRELFVQQASDYYSLIRQFRQIEINCQNYFTLAREFNQRFVEIRFGFAARTQLDQVEQQVINGRQSILSTCTSLENALDSLKIRMGIPTEQPLNLDLSELNLLTLRDELAVNADLIDRARLRIRREEQAELKSPFVIVGGLSQLLEHMLDSIALRDQLGEQAPESAPLEDALLDLRIEAADIDIAEDVVTLQLGLEEVPPNPTKVIQRRRDVIDEVLKKVNWQIKSLHRVSGDDDSRNGDANRLKDFLQRFNQLEKDLLVYIGDPVANENTERQLLVDAEALQTDLQAVATDLDRELVRTVPGNPQAFVQRALDLSAEFMPRSESYMDTAGGGLVAIEIEMDDAMMTALVQRFDLMNQRGFLADDWRQIKYAADELKSVLNLQASQSIRTRRNENRPFDFTFDDSNTSLGVTFDLPFNRRSQRNQYRASLFNYQSTLRGVMQLEDTVKLSVRRDLRALNLDRQQYVNDIAGAALASERVTGTELEVRGGFATSRDFLESQTAYVQAVSNVASRHINYIVGRLQLFLDLESLEVGDNGFWDQLYDENYQPQTNYQLPGYEPAYGQLHPKLKYSKRISRMRCAPVGQAMVHQRVDEGNSVGESGGNVQQPAMVDAEQ